MFGAHGTYFKEVGVSQFLLQLMKLCGLKELDEIWRPLLLQDQES